MTSSHHVSLPLQSILDELQFTIPECDPQDVDQTTTLMRRLGELRTTLEKEKSGPLSDVCGVALLMVDMLSRNGLVGPKESMDVVEDIVGVVRTGLGLPKQAKQKERTGQSELERTHAPLKLVDSQRLGELLVTLSMLKSEDVEAALKLQKMSGMLLGEALVEQGKVTKESIQAALRFQSTRRRQEGKTRTDWRDTLR
jgi:hypothetical protein